jgi:hypothetical protein
MRYRATRHSRTSPWLLLVTCGLGGACATTEVADRGASAEAVEESAPVPADPDGAVGTSAAPGDGGTSSSREAADAAVGACGDLTTRDCVGGESTCGRLVPFEPVQGPGYDNYPLNGETLANQYRSFARVELVMLIKWATAFTACTSRGWPGNGAPLGLGDMSEVNGAIPGTSVGQPGHPQGTHVNGFDMDIAYYQRGAPDNRLRPVCPHTSGGQDQYHCTGAPTDLDVDRTALFVGALLTSSRVRVIGVDGQVGPLVEGAMTKLCQRGTLPAAACANAARIAYEVTNQGRGWYQFHHHHLHVSLAGRLPNAIADRVELGGDLEDLAKRRVPGEAWVAP